VDIIQVWDILKTCWKKGKETKTHATTNNYLEMLTDDEATTLEQLNTLCGSKHDFFLELTCLKKNCLWKCNNLRWMCSKWQISGT